VIFFFSGAAPAVAMPMANAMASNDCIKRFISLLL
jgi:hypothetical protein